jgi:Icc-related predicted phosphoesterase
MISDTHEKHLSLNGFMPEGDVLIHAGDFTMQGEPLYVNKFNEWLGTLPYSRKIVIPGNHELTFDEKFNPRYLEARAGITNATLLINQSIIIDGIKFYGMPDTPEFCNWAFNRTSEEMESLSQAIPNDVDVLITHGPPYGHLDQTRINGDNLGCRKLRNRVDNIRPKVHVFGHIHGGYGKKEDIYGTTFVNASICTERYRPLNLPIVIEV